MALTESQRTVCRLLAANRVASGESYVAGGIALGEWLGLPRLSRDIDLFHDTESALETSWAADQALLTGAGYTVRVLRERASFVEAEVCREGATLLLEWARDSSFRFFPLVEHPDLGLSLHPFDLATNKLLALVGRREPRDWFDVIESHARLQPLGYLAWAACGKDPGFSPKALLDISARTARFTSEELATLSFEGPPPDLSTMSGRWRTNLETARAVVEALPAEQAGTCVLSQGGQLFTGTLSQLSVALDAEEILFHRGHIRGTWPAIRPHQ